MISPCVVEWSLYVSGSYWYVCLYILMKHMQHWGTTILPDQCYDLRILQQTLSKLLHYDAVFH